MTSQNLATANPRQKLESNADQVIAMLLNGDSERAVAAVFGASRRGVELFKARHEIDLKQVKEAAVEAVKENWIADKAQRVAKLQWLAELTETEIREYGITTEKVTLSEDGGPHYTRDYRASAVKELRGLLKDAAIEEGQIVPASPNKGGLMREVIIREYEGVPQEYIG